MRGGGALEPLVRPAVPRLVRREFVGTRLFVGGHEGSITALRSSTPGAAPARVSLLREVIACVRKRGADRRTDQRLAIVLAMALVSLHRA